MSAFIILSGLPGSGKSTLGALLARELEVPFLDKDMFLEALFEKNASITRTELSRRADDEFRIASLNVAGAVLVSWWKHPRSTRDSGTPTDWLHRLSGRLIEVHCACSPATAMARFRSRVRHERHGDAERADFELITRLQEQASLGPLGFSELVRVDTEQSFSIDAIVRRLRFVNTPP